MSHLASTSKYPLKTLTLAGLLLLGACTGVENSGTNYQATGILTDSDGNAVAGATVTLDGIAAASVTANDGSYTISSPVAWGSNMILTASAAEHQILSTQVSKPDGQDTSLSIPTQALPAHSAPNYLHVSGPVHQSAVVYDACDPSILVHGVAGQIAADNPRLDVVVLLDQSGSSSRVVGNQSIFAHQIDAARNLSQQLCTGLARMAVVAFAASATVQQDLSDDTTTIGSALDDLANDGPLPIGAAGSGTNFAAALDAARSHFIDNPLQEYSSEDDSLQTIATRRVVILLSDGVPTLPSGSGLVQDRSDIDATLAAGQRAVDADISIHCFAVALGANEARLTTMPTLAHISGGSYTSLSDPAALTTQLRAQGLTGVGTIRVHNLTTGDSVDVTPQSDGCFTASLPITTGVQSIRVEAFGASPNNSISETRIVDAILNPPTNTPLGLADDPVSVRGFISPYGRNLANNTFAQTLRADFPDLHESIGTQVFAVTGTAGSTTTVTVELVVREACWHSDIGYVIVDPEDLVNSTSTAFAAASASQVLFNTHSVNPTCATTVFSPGSATATFQAQAGSHVVFFMVPKGTLARAQDGKGKKPYFSVDSKNPGGFDQMLTYYSANGRQASGTPTVVIAIEDMPLAHGTNKDFWDICLAADNLVSGLHGGCPTTTN